MLNRPSKAVVTRVVGIVGALVAFSAFLVLSNAPGSVFAQDTGVIMYAENGTTPVRTFTSEDPEGMGIHWDVTGIDADDFEISGGVLTFVDPPNYESETDRMYDAIDMNDDGDTSDPGEDGAAKDNFYRITIRASEMRASGYMGRALSTETDVIVQVTDRNEPGVATLNRRQPEVGTGITASLHDPDGITGTTDTVTTVSWQWYVSTVTNPLIEAENHWADATGDGKDMATYFPYGDCVNGTRGNGHQTAVAACPGPTGTSLSDPNRVVDENKKLRVVATYNDSFGTERKARVVSEFPVRAEVSSDLDLLENPANGSPGFDRNLSYTRTVSESLGKGMNVGAPVRATDPNSDDTLTYELMAVDDDAIATGCQGDLCGDVDSFAIDKATAQITVKNTLDFDMNGSPPDGNYKFMVVAIDPSGETAEVEVTVVAEDANDTPVIMGSRSSTLTLDDPTPGPASEIRVMEQDSDDRDDNNQPDATYYGTTDGMEDEDMDGSAMGLSVALVLGNQNVFTVSDEDERGQPFWDLRGEDAADFTLTQGGTTSTGVQGSLSGPDEPIALVFTNAPDFEMPTDANWDSVYKVILVARDSAGAESTRPITIFVDNVPEQGMATLSVEQPFIGTEIEAMVEDPDGGEAVITWQWSKTHGNLVDDDFTVIYGATTSTYTPEIADDGAYLRVTATYIDTTSDMDDPETGTRDERVQESTEVANTSDAKTATMGDGVFVPTGEIEPLDSVFRVMATSAFAVREDPTTPPPVMAPEFAESSYEVTVMENAEVGSIVGMPIRATGANVFTYDLESTETNDNSYFTIDENYGQIRVGEVDFPSVIPATIIGPDGDDPDMEDPALDFEGTNTFVLIVTATDTGDENRTAKTRVTVGLNDLNERPYFDKTSRDAVADPKMYAETRTNMVVPLTATELDGDDLHWEVTGVDAADFEIRGAQDVGDGKDRVELHFKNQPDFENPNDAAGDTDRNGEITGTNEEPKDNFYHVTVRVTETTAVGGGPNMAAELDVVVQVTNSDEPGTVELNWLQPEVGTPITAAVTDPDGAVTIPTWTWYRAKVSNPNRNPSTDDTNVAFINEWQIITDVSSTNPADDATILSGATYTPQGDDADVDNTDADNAGDVALDEGWHLLARVQYTDPEDAGKAAVGISPYPVKADVSDADNNSPDFNQDTTTRTEPENTAVGDPVGRNNPVDVDQNEDGDRLTYQLDNDRNAATPLNAPTGAQIVGGAVENMPGDVAYFSINKATGQLSVAKKLDWDNNPVHPDDADGEYVFWVRATDPSGEGAGEDNDYIKVTVTATNVNDAPRVVDGRDEISLNEVNSTAKDDDATKFVGLGYRLTGTAPNQTMEMDPANPNLYHRSDEDRVDRGIWPEPLAGPDGRLFEYVVPEDGIGRRLLFKKANLPDYENPQDANRDNVYEVTIVLRDNGNAQGTKNVRITVMNVDEKGKVELSPEDPDSGMPVMAMLTDPDGVEYITDRKWYTTGSRLTTIFNDDGTLVAGVREQMGETTDEYYTGAVGSFVWTMVDYRDGYSMEDDPVTALDERNDDPDSTRVEQHKYEITEDAEGNPVTNDQLFHNSDQMESDGTDNAVQKDPAEDGDVQLPSTSPILVDRMVYENVPSTGYTGIPLDISGEMGLRYKDANGVPQVRDTIGGQDGASFVFAEGPPFVTNAEATNYDIADADFYDMKMTDSDNIEVEEDDDPNDKMGQLAANVVTHFNAEGDKTEYIIEVTDPDAEVAVGPVRVTITVMNVNEAPTAPMEQRGGLSVTGRENPMFNEILADDVAPDLMVGTYRGIGVDAADADWSLSGPDMGKFTIDASTGELTFDAAPDFENPIDANTDNRYQITVEADDGTNTATLPVTVMVVDVDEPGVVTLWRDDSAGMGQDVTTATLRVGDVVTGAVQDDPDGGVTNEMWKWYRSDAMDGTFTEITTGMMGDGDKKYKVMEMDAEMYLKVMATYDDNAPGSETAYVVSAKVVAMDAPMPDMTLLETYDTDGTPGISKPEYLAAADDYFDDIIDKPTLLEVADLYFDS